VVFFPIVRFSRQTEELRLVACAARLRTFAANTPSDDAGHAEILKIADSDGTVTRQTSHQVHGARFSVTTLGAPQ